MCQIWPLHLIIFYLLALCPMWVLGFNMTAIFNETTLYLKMKESRNVSVELDQPAQQGDVYYPEIRNSRTARVDFHYGFEGQDWIENYTFPPPFYNPTDGRYYYAKYFNFNFKVKVTGLRPGRTILKVVLVRLGKKILITNQVVIKVLKPPKPPTTTPRPTRPRPIIVDDTYFMLEGLLYMSVMALVSILYSNFGCIMDWPTMMEVFWRPYRPLIAMLGQFLFMPLLSFWLGYVIFPDWPTLHLGMFFSGVCIGFGGATVWTFLLGGNLNLSLVMTFTSALASFIFMPAWLYSLSETVNKDAVIVVPYWHMAWYTGTLAGALAIGYYVQRKVLCLARFLVVTLRGYCTVVALYIIISTILGYLYIFQYLHWNIILAGTLLPWLGYYFGYLLARIFTLPHADAVAISMHVGVLETSMTILLLRDALSQLEGNRATMVPIAVALMSPLPMGVLIIQKTVKNFLAPPEPPSYVGPRSIIIRCPTEPKIC